MCPRPCRLSAAPCPCDQFPAGETGALLVVPPAGALGPLTAGPPPPDAEGGGGAGVPAASSLWHPASTGIAQAATQSASPRFIFFVMGLSYQSPAGMAIVRDTSFSCPAETPIAAAVERGRVMESCPYPAGRATNGSGPSNSGLGCRCRRSQPMGRNVRSRHASPT